MPSCQDLKELLEKISKTKEKLQIEMNYDGKGEFQYKVIRTNLTASEFVPKKD